MLTQRLTYLLLFGLISQYVSAQDIEVHDLRKTMGTARLNIETSAVFHQKKEASNYAAFGGGFGIELLTKQKESSHCSWAPMILFNGANEELKTYSVENSSYYYRSTTLTGRLLFTTGFYYKRNIGKQLVFGIGFEPQFVLAHFQNQYTLGESAGPIPDINFRIVDVPLLASVTYSIDAHYSLNMIAQFGFTPIIQGAEQPKVNALRFQLSRRLK
ncbi:MAG: hypothetical protein ACI9JN_000893 [Bacteroidia bacterium]|jgi:hypothetical protein